MTRHITRPGDVEGREPPNTHLARGTWPDGSLRADAPVEVRRVHQAARRLNEHLGEHPSALGDAPACARRAAAALSTGDAWPNMLGLAELEAALSTRLWWYPDDPRR